jgi:hypothetical protein
VEFRLDDGRDIDIHDGHFAAVEKSGRQDAKPRSQGPVRSPFQQDLHANHCLSRCFIDAAAGFQVDRAKQHVLCPDPVTDMRLNQ